MSIPDDDVEFLDTYTALHALGSRSATVQHAIHMLRLSELAGAYGDAWNEWAASDDAVLWERTAPDGL